MKLKIALLQLLPGKDTNEQINIGLQACRMGIPVKFYRTAKFINKLNEQKKRGTYEKFIKQLDDTPVLILDEFGYVPYDRVGSELMFDYLSKRHEESRRVVILNTNLEFSQWVNVLYNANTIVSFCCFLE